MKWYTISCHLKFFNQVVVVLVYTVHNDQRKVYKVNSKITVSHQTYESYSVDLNTATKKYETIEIVRQQWFEVRRAVEVEPRSTATTNVRRRQLKEPRRLQW